MCATILRMWSSSGPQSNSLEAMDRFIPKVSPALSLVHPRTKTPQKLSAYTEEKLLEVSKHFEKVKKILKLRAGSI